MRTPIAYALAWPRRISSPSRRLDLSQVGQLTFHAPDYERFRCLGIALDCLRTGGIAPTILNAANEVAVEAFLNRRIGFLDIPRVVESALSDTPNSNASVDTLEAVLAADARARELAGNICRRVVN
jgi:1-deoxy-D-xylulose-5-phosphate reductoisomerase